MTDRRFAVPYERTYAVELDRTNYKELLVYWSYAIVDRGQSDVQNDYYFQYLDANGNYLAGDGGNPGSSGVQLAYGPLDAAPGVAINQLYVEVSNEDDQSSESWTVYDGALERTGLSIDASADTGEDIALGGYAADTIRTGSAWDWLDGGAGSDNLYGGSGNDTYLVSNGDKVFEAQGQGSDLVLASTSFTLTAGQEIERFETSDFLGSSPINLFGNEHSQTITGNEGNNILEGRGGNDVLDGGSGGDTLRGGEGDDKLIGGGNADTLTGGAGKDVFIFNGSSEGNVDHITDFKPSEDTVWLTKSDPLFHSLFGALPYGSLASDAFKDIGVAGAKVDADDRILYDHNSGRLWYDSDGSGSQGRVQFAILDTHPTITAASFKVVA